MNDKETAHIKTWTINKNIADMIRKVRKQKGLTQRDISKVLGKTPATVSDIERGKIQVNAVDLSRIAILLNKPIEYFYGIDNGSEEEQDPKELTDTQLKRVDILHSAAYNAMVDILDNDEDIEWNMEWIGEIADALTNVAVKYFGKTEMEIYPYIEEKND